MRDDPGPDWILKGMLVMIVLAFACEWHTTEPMTREQRQLIEFFEGDHVEQSKLVRYDRFEGEWVVGNYDLDQTGTGATLLEAMQDYEEN